MNMTDTWYNNDDLMKSIEDVEEKMDKIMIENVELKLRVADVNSKIDFLTKFIELKTLEIKQEITYEQLFTTKKDSVSFSNEKERI